MFRICSEFSVMFRICSEFSAIFRIFSICPECVQNFPLMQLFTYIWRQHTWMNICVSNTNILVYITTKSRDSE
jgi:hypothetical protein